MVAWVLNIPLGCSVFHERKRFAIALIVKSQALKFHALAIVIYLYRNFDLTVTITKVFSQRLRDSKKNVNNILLKTEDFREKNNQLFMID